MQNKNKTCAFTGHRILYKDFAEDKLYSAVEELILDGYDSFLCGMAQGFDLIAAKCVLDFKENYPLSLTAVCPCADQSKWFSRGDREIYDEVLENSDNTITLFPAYEKGCMYVRNRYLVDHSSVLLCYLRKSSGGTFYTVNYALKKNVKVVRI